MNYNKEEIKSLVQDEVNIELNDELCEKFVDLVSYDFDKGDPSSRVLSYAVIAESFLSQGQFQTAASYHDKAMSEYRKQYPIQTKTRRWL